MMRRLTADEPLRWALSDTAGACPCCEAGWHPHGGPSGAIYRRSRRSVTMRCARCGLQWAVTYHMLLRAVERQLAQARNTHNREALAGHIAELRLLAEAAGEIRGRRRRTGLPVPEAAG